MPLRGYIVSRVGRFSYWIDQLQEHSLPQDRMRFYPSTLIMRRDALPQSYMPLARVVW